MKLSQLGAQLYSDPFESLERSFRHVRDELADSEAGHETTNGDGEFSANTSKKRIA